MADIFDKYKIFSRRAFLMGAGQALVLGGLTARLGYLQLIESEKYKTLSDKNRIQTYFEPPSRGIIYDRNHKIIAGNTQSFRLMVVKERTDNLDETIARIQKLIDVPASLVEDFHDRAKRVASFTPIILKENLDWEEVARLEVYAVKVPGIFIEMGDQRFYENAYAVSHLTGYVGAISKEDLQKDTLLRRLPDLKIGKSGIEKSREQYLRGVPGVKKTEVNVQGREVRQLEKQPGQKGYDLTLSIDLELQSYIYDLLKDHKSASAVVMDAHTGALYASVSYPGYDPNLFVRGISKGEWQAILNDKTYPLNNKAVSGLYPPGSTFKMITALAALESGHANASTSFHCPGHFDLGRDRFHCWKRGGHGRVDVVEALSQSCDVWFYEVAAKMGVDRIRQMAHKFGLGVDLGFELPEEKIGLVPDEKWKLAHIGTRWQKGETVVAAIGQGYMQVTPLQLAVMTARLANGGQEVLPWVTEQAGAYDRPNVHYKKIPISARHLKTVLTGMERAVNDSEGTAFGSRIELESLQMAGKTGTSQVKRITEEERALGVQQEDLPWRKRHHALFVGYAPMTAPKYVVSVVVEHGIGGSRTAAPLAKRILLKTQQRMEARV